MGIVVSSRENSGTDACSERNLTDAEYADDVGLLSKDPSKLQGFSHRLNQGLGIFDFHFSTCKMLLKDWAGTKPNPCSCSEAAG